MAEDFEASVIVFFDLHPGLRDDAGGNAGFLVRPPVASMGLPGMAGNAYGVDDLRFHS
jgi:hypothetical protein